MLELAGGEAVAGVVEGFSRCWVRSSTGMHAGAVGAEPRGHYDAAMAIEDGRGPSRRVAHPIPLAFGRDDAGYRSG